MSGKKEGKNEGKKMLPCGACVLINILAGDTTIVRAYMNTMMFKMGWFRNIKALGDRERSRLVDDVSQDVSEAIFLSCVRGTLSEIKHFKSFLWAMVRNMCIKEERRIKRTVSMSLTQEHIENDVFVRSTNENTVSKCIKKEQLELIHKAVAELSPFERLLLCLRYKEGLSGKEIGIIIGETQNYVNVMLHNLRKKIRKKLEKLTQQWGELNGPEITPYS